MIYITKRTQNLMKVMAILIVLLLLGGLLLQAKNKRENKINENGFLPFLGAVTHFEKRLSEEYQRFVGLVDQQDLVSLQTMQDPYITGFDAINDHSLTYQGQAYEASSYYPFSLASKPILFIQLNHIHHDIDDDTPYVMFVKSNVYALIPLSHFISLFFQEEHLMVMSQDGFIFHDNQINSYSKLSDMVKESDQLFRLEFKHQNNHYQPITFNHEARYLYYVHMDEVGVYMLYTVKQQDIKKQYPLLTLDVILKLSITLILGGLGIVALYLYLKKKVILQHVLIELDHNYCVTKSNLPFVINHAPLMTQLLNNIDETALQQNHHEIPFYWQASDQVTRMSYKKTKTGHQFVGYHVKPTLTDPNPFHHPVTHVDTMTVLKKRFSNTEASKWIMVCDRAHSILTKASSTDMIEKAMLNVITRIQTELGSIGHIYHIKDDQYLIVIAKDKLKTQDTKKISSFLQTLKHTNLSSDIDIKNDLYAAILDFDPVDQMTLSTLLNRLNLTMEKALLSDDHLSYYDKNIELYLSKQAHMLAHLKTAITHDQFYMVYQTEHHLQTGKIVGLEALLRTQDPLYQLESPEVYIKLAETHGLMISLGWIIIDKVLDFMKTFKDQNIVFSINLSPQQLFEAGFVTKLLHKMAAYHIKVNRLAFEITEHSLIDINLFMDKLSSLKKHGIKVYLDDFGKGYSSLSYLKDLPIDAIKLNRDFIKELPSHEKVKDIITYIIKLSKSLNLMCIAEGIEDEETVTLLKSISCDYGQGYYYYRPLNEKEINQIINNKGDI